MDIRLCGLTIMAVAFLLDATAQADSTIENRWLRVEVDASRDSFTITSVGSKQPCVRAGKFAHPVTSIELATVKQATWGPGREVRIVHPGGWTTSLGLFRDHPFLHVHTTTHNETDEPFVTSALEVLDFEVDLGRPVSELRSFGTGFLGPVEDAPGSFSFSVVVDPRSRNGVVAACLTHEQGSGVFFTDTTERRVRVSARIDFGRYQVEPGESRKTETLLIGYFDDARLGLEAYADAVARQYEIELPPQPAVYCTWYHAGASDERRLLANARFAEKELRPWGLSVLQIDDKWQSRLPVDFPFDGDENDIEGVGPIKVFVDANTNYPSGMQYTARQLSKRGFVPGIWFMPFAGTFNNPYFAERQEMFAHWDDGTPIVTRWSGTLLDMSHPQTQTFVHDRVKRIADWGYRYFKLDGMHTGAVTHNVYVNTGYATEGRWLNSPNFIGRQDEPGGSSSEEPSQALFDPGMTHIQAYRKGLQTVREAAPDAFILGCNVSQNMRSMGGAFGLIDAMRIGPDNGGAGRGDWNSVCKGARHGSNLYFLNRRVWHNDPDPVYVRPSNPLESARIMVSWVAVTGSMLTTSYQFPELPPERLDLLKRCMPSHHATVRPVDLFESDPPTTWLLTDRRRDTSRYVMGLFNWHKEQPLTIDRDLKDLGLDANATYVAFDFWEQQFLEPFRGRLKQSLPGGSCRILAVRPAAEFPQLLSTSRHIAQCTVDLLHEAWDLETNTLCGTSRVVAGDPYELRIAFPNDKAWKVREASFGGQKLTDVETTSRGVRLTCTPQTSGDVDWTIAF
jgi:hypothetical protein